MSRPFRGTGVRDPERVGILTIGKLDFLRSKDLGHHKYRNSGEIGTVHQRGCVAEIRAIGKSPDKGAVHRCLVHWDIRDPGDELFVHFGIAKRDTSMSGSQLSTRWKGKKEPLGEPAVSVSRKEGVIV
jgi:hypothetical protein